MHCARGALYEVGAGARLASVCVCARAGPAGSPAGKAPPFQADLFTQSMQKKTEQQLQRIIEEMRAAKLASAATSASVAPQQGATASSQEAEPEDDDDGPDKVCVADSMRLANRGALWTLALRDEATLPYVLTACCACSLPILLRASMVGQRARSQRATVRNKRATKHAQAGYPASRPAAGSLTTGSRHFLFPSHVWLVESQLDCLYARAAGDWAFGGRVTDF